MDFEKRLESVQALIQGKDIQISSLQHEQESLEKEVKYLRELLELDSSGNKKQQSGSNLMSMSSTANMIEPNVLNSRDDKVKTFNKKQSAFFGAPNLSASQGKDKGVGKNPKEDFASNIEDLNVSKGSKLKHDVGCVEELGAGAVREEEHTERHGQTAKDYAAE